jgi:predicted glycosyltransferase
VENDLPISTNIDFYGLVKSDDINELMCKSEVVIARSGYSTIMDLRKLNKKAILIPTPGQTEQEYLAGFHGNSDQFEFIEEKNLTIDKVQDALDQLLN